MYARESSHVSTWKYTYNAKHVLVNKLESEVLEDISIEEIRVKHQ